MPTFKVTRPDGTVDLIDSPGIDEATRDVGFGDSVEEVTDKEIAAMEKAAAKEAKSASADEEGDTSE